jgi:PAS domain S-box-containing protein
MATKRILIVEDEQIVAEELQRSLGAAGYEIVGIAGSGEEAVTRGRQSRPDLVIMDIVLSGTMDGISAAQQLQTLGIPIVYLTAYSDRHLLERAQHTEPVGYVIKPPKTEELAAVIKLALFKREKEQERDRAGQGPATAHGEAGEQFRLMIAGVTDVAIFTLDTAGNVNSWNRGAEKINGYSAADIIGRHYSILFTAEDRGRGIPQKELEVAIRDGSADNTRFLVRQDGKQYWAEGFLSAIRDEGGTLTGFTKVIRDTTPHKRTQETLQKTEKRLRVALHAARMGTWEWEIESNKDTFDDSLRNLFGLGPDDQVNTIEDFYARIHPDDRANVVAAFERTRDEGIHLDTEFRVIRPDGTERWLMDQGEVLTDDQGKPLRMTGACVDITERKQAEQALRDSEERFRLFVNSVRDYALFQMDENGRITSWNAGAERMLGYADDEIIGLPSSVLFVAEDIRGGEDEQEIAKALLTGRSEDERWHIRKDGTRFWSSGVVTRIDDPQGGVRGLAKVMRDETERMQASEQMASSLAEKEALLKEIHHRVKNNLQVITSLLSLQSDTVDNDATRIMFEEAVNRVRTIGDIHELLYRSPDLARVNFDLYINRLVQSLSSFYGIDETRTAIRVNAQNTGLELAQAIPCGLIVNELLTNALKHGFPDGRSGEIQVMLECNEGTCVLNVADNGVGMPDEVTIENTTSLGLKLVSILARQLGGTVRIHRNGGTRFAISFPGSTPS